MGLPYQQLLDQAVQTEIKVPEPFQAFSAVFQMTTEPSYETKLLLQLCTGVEALQQLVGEEGDEDLKNNFAQIMQSLLVSFKQTQVLIETHRQNDSTRVAEHIKKLQQGVLQSLRSFEISLAWRGQLAFVDELNRWPNLSEKIKEILHTHLNKTVQFMVAQVTDNHTSLWEKIKAIVFNPIRFYHTYHFFQNRRLPNHSEIFLRLSQLNTLFPSNSTIENFVTEVTQRLEPVKQLLSLMDSYTCETLIMGDEECKEQTPKEKQKTAVDILNRSQPKILGQHIPTVNEKVDPKVFIEGQWQNRLNATTEQQQGLWQVLNMNHLLSPLNALLGKLMSDSIAIEQQEPMTIDMTKQGESILVTVIIPKIIFTNLSKSESTLEGGYKQQTLIDPKGTISYPIVELRYYSSQIEFIQNFKQAIQSVSESSNAPTGCLQL